MPTVNRIADIHDEITAWRRDFHAHPELLFDVHRTAGIVAEKLRAFGCDEVIEGIGQTGVVGVIRGRESGGKAVGLRADMDALPIQEARDLPHKSTVPGKMHACGHDGHTAMLLGAAKYLADTRNFHGTAVVIFQPAEEGGGGGEAMVADGMMARFDISQVYGMHNMPGLPEGSFHIRPGPLLAAADFFTIDIHALGGHAAKPHLCVDAVAVATQLHTAFQTIVARNVNPVQSAVLSVTQIHAGDADNVLPQTAQMRGTVRTLDETVRNLIEQRMAETVEHLPKALGAKAELDYRRLYPVTVNHDAETAFAAEVAREIAGDARVDADTPPSLGGEDFSFMLNERPGAMIYIGQGDSAGLHHPDYDFNDAIIPAGSSYWVRLIERALPVSP
ncbi:MAG: M20 aminoacylase family protein [Pseudomonadota bacterium]